MAKNALSFRDYENAAAPCFCSPATVIQATRQHKVMQNRPKPIKTTVLLKRYLFSQSFKRNKQ